MGVKEKKKQELHPLSHLNIRSLHCYVRDLETLEGSKVSRRFRANNLIPGVIQGRSSADKKSCINTSIGVITNWNLLQRELDLYHRWVLSHVYELTLKSSPIKGEVRHKLTRDEEASEIISKELVVPVDMQMHPWKNTMYSINFQRY